MHSLGRNSLEDEGTIAVCNALEQSKVSKLEELLIYDNGIGADGAKAVGSFCAVSSLTECNLQSNRLGKEGWTAIFTALRDSKVSKISTWNLHETGIKESVNVLAEYISVSPSLTKLDVRHNHSMGEEGKAALRMAVSGRSGFELLLLP